MRSVLSTFYPNAEYSSIAFESISYIKQLKLVSNSSIIIGTVFVTSVYVCVYA